MRTRASQPSDRLPNPTLASEKVQYFFGIVLLSGS